MGHGSAPPTNRDGSKGSRVASLQGHRGLISRSDRFQRGYSEWLASCLMHRWMDSLIRWDHRLQFASPHPPSFAGIVETVLSFSAQNATLWAELQA